MLFQSIADTTFIPTLAAMAVVERRVRDIKVFNRCPNLPERIERYILCLYFNRSDDISTLLKKVVFLNYCKIEGFDLLFGKRAVFRAEADNIRVIKK